MSSSLIQQYRIESLWESKSYLFDAILNPPLAERCKLVLSHKDKSAKDIFVKLDAMILGSSAILFSITYERFGS
jgi:uncharacterized protein (DUF1810 family)